MKRRKNKVEEKIVVSNNVQEDIVTKKNSQQINLPNMLTLLRVALVPIILMVLLFPYEQLDILVPTYRIVFVDITLVNIIVCFIFCFASFTDFLDGYLARKYNLISNFGKFLDPLADKLLTTTLFIVYAAMGIIPVVPVIIMIWRDLMVDGIRMICATENIVVSAGIYGKLKTVAQMLTLILVSINNLPFELLHIPMADILLWFSLATSVISGLVYLVQAKDTLLKSK